jgi:hypothetical protein
MKEIFTGKDAVITLNGVVLLPGNGAYTVSVYERCSCPSYPWSDVECGPDYKGKLCNLLHKLLHRSPYGD